MFKYNGLNLQILNMCKFDIIASSKQITKLLGFLNILYVDYVEPHLHWLSWYARNLSMRAVRKMRLVLRMYMLRKVNHRHTVLYLR